MFFLFCFFFRIGNSNINGTYVASVNKEVQESVMFLMCAAESKEAMNKMHRKYR